MQSHVSLWDGYTEEETHRLEEGRRSDSRAETKGSHKSGDVDRCLKLQEASTGSPRGRQRDCVFAKTLISDSWSLELCDSTFLLFKALGNEYNVEHDLPALRFLELLPPHRDHVLLEGRAPELPSWASRKTMSTIPAMLENTDRELTAGTCTPVCKQKKEMVAR